MKQTQSTLSGIMGQILRINLTTRTFKTETYPFHVFSEYLGGRGLGAYYLYREVSPTCDPLSIANKLIFMNGPLSGSLISGNNKINLTFKSPLSNSYSYSLCGGHWGPELKYAGFDGLIIEGKSEHPVILSITNDDVQFHNAEAVWGKIIPESEREIRTILNDTHDYHIAVIGPAGEQLNRYACITTGLYREFGRGGAGCVMGSKNLKAIAIKGTRGVYIENLPAHRELATRLQQQMRASAAGQVRRQYGTPEMVEKINNNEFWITKNFQEAFFSEGKKLEGRQMRTDIVVGDASCFACPIGCGKRSFISSDTHGEILIEGPEFETIGMLGSNCGISDWATLLKATQICDQYGFDTINAGGCISFAMECYENGIITKDQTDGIPLNFGNPDALLYLLTQIAHRKGIGDILAEGLIYAGNYYHAPQFAMHSKGQAFAVYDPRGCKGMALTYATSPKGAHHMVATTMGYEIGSATRLAYEGKGQLQRQHQFSMAIVDALGLCATMRGGLSLDDQIQALNSVTGTSFTESEILLCAERILNLEKLYNLQVGLTRADDALPSRFLSEPILSGINQGETVDLSRLLDDFYSVMGWDANGVPSKVKLTELGLWDLWQSNKP